MILLVHWSDSEVGSGLVVKNQVVWLEIAFFSISCEDMEEHCLKKVISMIVWRINFKRFSSAHSGDSSSSRGQESITDENGAIFLDSHSGNVKQYSLRRQCESQEPSPF